MLYGSRAKQPNGVQKKQINGKQKDYIKNVVLFQFFVADKEKNYLFNRIIELEE